MEVNKKELKEQEIRTLFITPALQRKGWAVSVNMREEYYFTDGRVLVIGNQHSVAEGKKADYLLYHKGKPIAVVEAKDNKHAVGGGIQQAMDYAQILDLKFAYSSNGDAFLEHDFITGKETEIKLEDFPTEEELYNRYLESKSYTSEELNIIETPFYYDAHSHEPRYYKLPSTWRYVSDDRLTYDFCNTPIPPEVLRSLFPAPQFFLMPLQVLPFSPLPCPPFMSFSFCLYYKYLCRFSQSDYVMLHHFFTIAFIQSKYRWYRLQAKLLPKQSACMFFIQSRKIHFFYCRSIF